MTAKRWNHRTSTLHHPRLLLIRRLFSNNRNSDANEIADHADTELGKQMCTRMQSPDGYTLLPWLPSFYTGKMTVRKGYMSWWKAFAVINFVRNRDRTVNLLDLINKGSVNNSLPPTSQWGTRRWVSDRGWWFLFHPNLLTQSNVCKLHAFDSSGGLSARGQPVILWHCCLFSEFPQKKIKHQALCQQPN